MRVIDDKEKAKRLAAARNAMKNLDKLLKKKNTVIRLSDHQEVDVECIPTGSISLDVACGGFGVARGRIVELFGAESSGKSLICQRLIAACQEQGGQCAYIDVEHTFDPKFARKLKVDTDSLFVSQPDHMQDTIKIVDALIDSQAFDIIVLDSIASLVPQEELEEEAGKQTVGLVARYMSQFLRRITPKLSKTGTVLVCINQVRQKIGVNAAA